MSYVTAMLRAKVRAAANEVAAAAEVAENLRRRAQDAERASVDHVLYAYDVRKLTAPFASGEMTTDQVVRRLASEPGEPLNHYLDLDFRKGEHVAEVVTALLKVSAQRRQLPLRVVCLEGPEYGRGCTLRLLSCRAPGDRT